MNNAITGGSLAQKAACALVFSVIAIGASGAEVDKRLGTTTVDNRMLENVVPSSLLAIDQNRSTVIDKIVVTWGPALEQSGAGIGAKQLREMLSEMRADQLLAASLAGTLEGLRNVIAMALVSDPAVKPSMAKALGDPTADLVYTPVSPCRLFDTRASQGGLGTPTLGVRRTYGARTPVTNQGGPGGCAAAATATVALIQIGTLTPSGSGILQGGAQGVASFPNALILYQAGDQYGTAVAMPLNPANGQFDLVELSATADLYGDLLGYFSAPNGLAANLVTTGAIANAAVSKTKLSATGGTFGQVLTTDGTALVWETLPSISRFAGAIASIAGSSSVFVFAGATTSVTIPAGANRRVTASAVGAMGLPSGGPQNAQLDMCYQLAAGTVNPFGIDWLNIEFTTTRSAHASTGTQVLGPGTYNIGLCVNNIGAIAISDNDWVQGWAMLTPL